MVSEVNIDIAFFPRRLRWCRARFATRRRRTPHCSERCRRRDRSTRRPRRPWWVEALSTFYLHLFCYCSFFVLSLFVNRWPPPPRHSTTTSTTTTRTRMTTWYDVIAWWFEREMFGYNPVQYWLVFHCMIAWLKCMNRALTPFSLNFSLKIVMWVLQNKKVSS